MGTEGGWPAIRAGHCSARRQVGRRGVLPVIPELDVVLDLFQGYYMVRCLPRSGSAKGTAALRMRIIGRFGKAVGR